MGYQIGLRIPDDVLAKAREAANEEGRSLSNLILFALKRHIEQATDKRYDAADV